MTQVFMRRHGDALYPMDEAGRAAVRRVAEGKGVRVEVKRTRNIQHHRLFWALAGKVAENSKIYETAEQVVTALKIALGHVETIIHPLTGEVYYVPKSISFESMDQDGFREFFDRCVDVISARFLPGVTKEALRQEIEQMIGVRAA